ncbi:hypothetical protein ACMU_02760 [Actibacterium mucosum KCTC 23349]|uniref:Uncharacterized protein n=1 Tax=Actibacterium mucosum KCTC 23349 TaxID=1454373 RepID=A0A037ZRI1_9RHOB|nr:hypothetical protein [Actibacterium mucosum]KAJ57442.1 hypothetical protein ACMU_02760 [Actibacterium mucosum KCTC 23349]
MFKTTCATLIAATLALSPVGARPVLADKNSDTAAAVLLGALAIYGISQASKKDKKKPEPTPEPVVATHTHTFTSHHARRYQLVRYGHGILPLSCLRAPTGLGKGQPDDMVLPDKCLSNVNYRGLLPRSCETYYTTKKGKSRAAYSASCLTSRGFLIGGKP